MRLIFDPDVDDEDFMEIILTEEQIESIKENGVTKDFKHGFYGRNLNVFIRKELSHIDD